MISFMVSTCRSHAGYYCTATTEHKQQLGTFTNFDQDPTNGEVEV